jgi:Ssp1 endopeptidase immunity protein Rap1a
MRRLAMVALVLTTFTATSYGQTEENRASANYLVPLCKSWLDFADKDSDTLQNMGRTEPVRLAAAGVCVGAIFGVLEDLRSIKLACPPKGINNPQLIRTVLSEIEKNPDRMKDDFVLLARSAMMRSWPCRKKRGPHRL